MPHNKGKSKSPQSREKKKPRKRGTKGGKKK